MANLNQSTGGDHDNKPLRKIAEAFKSLSNSINKDDNNNNSQTLENENCLLELAPFSNACSLVSPLFRCLGIAFRFAEMDYVSKVSTSICVYTYIFIFVFVLDD